MNFEIKEEKFKFILAKLMKNPSIRDSCSFIDIIDACVKESAFEHLLIDRLEACLLDDAKNDKGNTKAKVYEEVLDKSPTSSN